MDWFLYDIDLRHEQVLQQPKTLNTLRNSLYEKSNTILKGIKTEIKSSTQELLKKNEGSFYPFKTTVTLIPNKSHWKSDEKYWYLHNDL